ncbi:MAG: hypothetical protein P1P81_05380 [Desulfobulbales bacterium]|nr:hypothetical protein [Desulfobulbales bacterium]
MHKTVPALPAPLCIVLVAALFTLSGCFHTGSPGSADSGREEMPAAATNQFEPFYPADFNNLQIPGELVWNREKSVVLSTDSFKGGILNFNGRVEVTSLMEFFSSSMKKDGWTAVGSLKSKNVLLAFTKANSSCMIQIMEGGPIGKTDVHIYIANSNQ